VWDGLDSREATLLEVPKHVTFSNGDTLVTTVYSTIFPEGVMVGRVKGSKIKAGDNFYTIQVSLSTNFANLSHVYIVDNLLKGEQLQLEAKTQATDDN
jgi:rod shape-determining protein MreC